MYNHSNLPQSSKNLNDNQPPTNQSKSWIKTILGIFLILDGLLVISHKQLLPGICFVISGLILFPPSAKVIEERLNIQLSGVVKNSITIGLVLLAFMIIGAMEDHKAPKIMSVKTDTTTIQSNINKNDDSTDSIPNKNTITHVGDEERQEKIDHIFSSWDGSDLKLVFYVKDQMNDPDSFEHISTNYWDKGTYLVVLMKFRGKNAFGGKVINYVKAKVDLDGEVLKIIDDGN